MSEECRVQHQDGVVDRRIRCRRQQTSLEDVARCEAEKDDIARGTAVSHSQCMFDISHVP